MTLVTLYGKPGCCLCDDARDAVRAMRRRYRFDLEEVDITRDPLLESRYRELIPVVAVDGEEISELVLEAEVLEERLASMAP